MIWMKIAVVLIRDNAFGVQPAKTFTPAAKNMTEIVKPPHFRSFYKCQILLVISTPRENVDFLLIRNNGLKLDLPSVSGWCHANLGLEDK